MASEEERLEELLGRVDRAVAEVGARFERGRAQRRRFDEGLVACPAGYALVLAAADWLRAGRLAPVPLAKLHEQAARRWSRLHPDQPLRDADLDHALEWATAGPAPLLTSGDTGSEGQGYRAPDGLALYLTSLHGDLPQEALLAMATPLEAVAIGVEASTQGEDGRALAVRAWERAASDGDADAAGLARWHLGNQALEDGDAVAARAAFEEVIACGHFDAAPRAMVGLALIELEAGAVDAAHRLLEEAIASRHPDIIAKAALALAELRDCGGDTKGAKAAYLLAVDTGDLWNTPLALYRLARLLEREGDDAGARHAYQRVIDSRSPVLASEAASALGSLLRRGGDLRGAKTALRKAVDYATPDARPAAVLALTELLLAREEVEEAEELIEQLREELPDDLDDRPALAWQLRFQLARVRVWQGEYDAARRLFAGLFTATDPDVVELIRTLVPAVVRELRARGAGSAPPGTEPLLRYVADAGAPDDALWAEYNLAVLAYADDRAEEATASFHRVAESDHPRYAPMATFMIAQVLELQGDHVEAREAYLRVLDGQACSLTGEAARRIGDLAARLDGAVAEETLARARAACWRHVEAGGPYAAKIAFDLGLMEPDIYDAAPAWEAAARAGDPDVTPYALYNLGVVGERRIGPVSAALAFQRALDTGHPDIVPKAALGLGQVAMRCCDEATAAPAFLRALETGHPTIAPAAASELGELMRPFDPCQAELALCYAIEAEEAEPATVGQALARLGRVYAEQGNRALAEATWRRGRRHPDPLVAAAFREERRRIGRVRGRQRRPGPR